MRVKSPVAGRLHDDAMMTKRLNNSTRRTTFFGPDEFCDRELHFFTNTQSPWFEHVVFPDQIGISHALCLAMLYQAENASPEGGPKPITIKSQDFQAQVLESKLPVLVEFCTFWSLPCRVSDSVLQEVAHDLEENIKIMKVNADDSLDLSLCYEIQSIPTLIFFFGGKPSFRIVGTASKEAILEKLRTFFQRICDEKEKS